MTNKTEKPPPGGKQMRYKIFGRRTGLRDSELALGTGNFGTRWSHGAERGDVKKMRQARSRSEFRTRK
jgi:hypothetical protein